MTHLQIWLENHNRRLTQEAIDEALMEYISHIEAELESLRAWKADIEKQEPVACVGVRDFEYHKSNDMQTSLGVWRTADYKSKLLPSREPMFLFAAPVVSPDVEMLKAEIAELKSHNKLIMDMYVEYSDENRSLKAELEAARMDAEHYRFITGGTFVCDRIKSTYVEWGGEGGIAGFSAVVDAAIEQAQVGCQHEWDSDGDPGPGETMTLRCRYCGEEEQAKGAV